MVWRQWLIVMATMLATVMFGCVVASADTTGPPDSGNTTQMSTSQINASPLTASQTDTTPLAASQPDMTNSSGPSLGAVGNSIQSAAQNQLDSLPTGDLQQYWQQLQQQYGGYLPNASGGSLVHAIMDSGGFNLNGLIHGCVKYFLSEILDNVKLLGAILLLTVLASVLETLQSAFERQVVSQVAYAIIFLVLLSLAIGSFTEAIGYARHAIQSMNDFMLATVPLVVSLLAASGALASAAFFQPVLLFAVHLISNVVYMIVFPLVFFSAVLDIVSALSPRYKLTRLAGLLRTGGLASLSLCLAVFLGVTSVQGLGKGIVDGVTMRSAKVAVSTLVPVIGKALSDAAETVASASMLVKNAVGIAGLVIIACMALFPALKILALSLIYNGSAALMQPLGETPVVQCLGSLSKSLILVFASVLAVALMFFLAICILLVSANLAVVMA